MSMTGRRSHTLGRRWADMLRRCANPAHARWERYGGRGIKVCQRWLSLDNFWDDMADSWEQGLVLDRIDNDGDYTPENCRWTTYSISNYNRCYTPWLMKGEVLAKAIELRSSGMSYRAIGEELGIAKTTVQQAIKREVCYQN